MLKLTPPWHQRISLSTDLTMSFLWINLQMFLIASRTQSRLLCISNGPLPDLAWSCFTLHTVPPSFEVQPDWTICNDSVNRCAYLCFYIYSLSFVVNYKTLSLTSKSNLGILEAVSKAPSTVLLLPRCSGTLEGTGLWHYSIIVESIYLLTRVYFP